MKELEIQDIAKITDQIDINIVVLPEGGKIGFKFTSKLDGCMYGSYLYARPREHLEDMFEWVELLLSQAEFTLEALLKAVEKNDR